MSEKIPPIESGNAVHNQGTQQKLSPQKRNGLAVEYRFLIAGGVFVLLAGIALGLYIFGMLMFAFSGDGAISKSYPKWIEPFMLIGWPMMLVMATLVPPAVVLFGVRLRYGIPLIAFALILPVVTYFAVWGYFIYCVSK